MACSFHMRAAAEMDGKSGQLPSLVCVQVWLHRKSSCLWFWLIYLMILSFFGLVFFAGATVMSILCLCWTPKPVHSERQDITYLSLFFGLPGWLLYLLIPFSPFWLPVLHLLPSSLIILLSSTISDVELGRLSGLQFEQLSATQRALLIGSPGAVPFGATEWGSYTEGMLTHVSLKTIEQTGASLMYFTD